MRLSSKKSGKDIFYYVLDSWRDGKTVKSKTIYTIGKKSAIEKEHPDVDGYVKKTYADFISQFEHDRLEYQNTIDFSARMEAGNDEASRSTTLNIGWLYAKKVYEMLDIPSFMKSITEGQKYDVNSVNLMLTALRIVRPESKRASFLSSENFMVGFDEKLHDGYRFLKLLDSHANEYQKHLFENTKKNFSVSTDVIYYDCTNFFCETNFSDDDILNEDGDIIQFGLRKYGFSKEHRPNPIVQMGLMVDRNGIPIAYDIHPGNTNEQTTIFPLEQRIVSEYRESNFIYCADSGLNSYPMRLLNSINNRSYIVTQPLSRLKEADLKLVMQDANWLRMSDNTPVSYEAFRSAVEKKYDGKELSEEEEKLLENDMIYKEYPIKKAVEVGPEHGFKKKVKAELEETLYVTFSAKYYFYCRDNLEEKIKRAKQLIESGRIKSASRTSPKSIVSETAATDSGEVAENKSYALNEEKIGGESLELGLYAMATSFDAGKIKEVMDIAKSRWQIEYQFMIMKTFLLTRPFHVSTKEGIAGHIAICYAALLIINLMKKKVNAIKGCEKVTINQLLQTLKNMCVIADEKEIYYRSLYTGSKTLEGLEKAFGLGLDHNYYRKNSLDKQLSAKAK